MNYGPGLSPFQQRIMELADQDGTVAVSRAFTRLAERGLAERIIGGVIVRH